MGIVSKNRRKRNKKQKEKMRTLKITTLPSVKEQPWCDRDYIMFHACFQLLVDCVEQERLFDNWECNSEVQADLKTLYEWWKSSKDSENYDSSSKEAQKNLELLIKHRQFLWV